MRHLTDALGREWHVYERKSAAESSSPGKGSLIFDTEGIVRRLWQYPRTWRELPDDALLGLMENPADLRRSMK